MNSPTSTIAPLVAAFFLFFPGYTWPDSHPVEYLFYRCYDVRSSARSQLFNDIVGKFTSNRTYYEKVFCTAGPGHSHETARLFQARLYIDLKFGLSAVHMEAYVIVDNQAVPLHGFRTRNYGNRDANELFAELADAVAKAVRLKRQMDDGKIPAA